MQNTITYNGRWTHRVLLILIGSLLINCSNRNDSTDFDRFTGRWKLLTIQRYDSAGNVWVNSEGRNRNRKGFIIYDGLGGMGVHHVSEGYEQYAFEGSGGFDDLTENDLRHMANNFVYFGRYNVVESEKTIEHHIESHSNPAAWGTIAKRTYQFKGDTLILMPTSGSSGIPVRIVWLKLEDKP